jgi:hypothetical protein
MSLEQVPRWQDEQARIDPDGKFPEHKFMQDEIYSLRKALNAELKRRESEADNCWQGRALFAEELCRGYAVLVETLSAQIASPPSQPSTGVPDGWQLAPIEPTVTMVEAVINCIYSHAYSSEEAYASAIYSAAMSAAPRSP